MFRQAQHDYNNISALTN